MKKLRKPCRHRKTVITEMTVLIGTAAAPSLFGDTPILREFEEQCERCNAVLRRWRERPEPTEASA